MHCLWLARAMPFPLTAGDRIYSGKLAAALANAGAEVVFVGLSAGVPPQPTPGIAWHVVPGSQRSQHRALFSILPLVTARHATAIYKAQALDLIRSRQWDAIIIDHYGSGWLRHAVMSAAGRPVRVFIGHNHEASVTASQWRDRGRSMIDRAYLWQNWLKAARLEKTITRNSDLITAITDVDAERFVRDAPGVRTLQLSPGYDGVRLAHRTITAETPRSIVLFGSYLWSAKRASLTLFLDQADAVMAAAGITIDVVGDMDQKLQRILAARYRAARFHGLVQDAAPYLARARMAVLAEPVGGGFKLKLLDYIFNRVPIAALADCAQGLPQAVRTHMLLEDDIPSLLAKVLVEIDRIDCLNRRHDGAFRAAGEMFDWRHRGSALLSAIENTRSARRNAEQTSDPAPRLRRRV